MGRTVKLFVSSPYDVRVERRRVQIVADRLNATFSDLTIECYRWEDGHTFLANETFATQIPETRNFDLVIGILWSRLGVPPPDCFGLLPDGRPYPSGTAYELITAMESGGLAQGGADVMVYRKTAPVSLPPRRSEAQREQLQQIDQLTTFMEEWFYSDEGGFRAAFHEFAAVDDFDRMLEKHLTSWLDENGIGHGGTVWNIERDGSPYRGLDPYDSTHASVFFGRDRIIDEYCRVLDEAEANGTAFLVIDGPSGAGKSSLVRAGLLPRLSKSAEIPNSIRVATLFPGRHLAPIAALSRALFEPTALPELQEGDFADPESLANLLRASCDSTAIIAALDRMAQKLMIDEGYGERPQTQLLLFVDQGEELLSDHHDSSERDRFLALLAHLAESGRCRILFTIRARTYGALVERLGSDAAFAQLLNRGARRTLEPPGRDMLGEIIRRPAAAAGLQFERRDGTGLDERLLADASGSNPLPLLQYVLAQLFDRMSARSADGRGSTTMLTFSDYESLGGVEQAIDQTAERACRDLPKGALEAVPRLVRSLTDAAEDGLVLSSAPLDNIAGDAEIRALVRALVGARIVVEEGHRNPRIRFAHDKVLTAWNRAQRASEQALEYNRDFDNLRNAHEQWLRHGQRSDALLPGGIRLEEAKALQRNYPNEMPEDLQSFLNRSIRYSRRKLRLAQGIAVLLAVLAVFAGVQFFIAERNAQQAEDRLRAVDLAFNSVLNDALGTTTADQSAALAAMHRIFQSMHEQDALPEESVELLPILRDLNTTAFVRNKWQAATEARERDRFAEALQYVDESLHTITVSELSGEEKNTMLRDGLGRKSFLYLLTGKFEAATQTAREANSLGKPQLWIIANEAHGLLLDGQFDAAVVVYRAHLGKRLPNGQTWSTAVRNDFDILSKAQITIPRRLEIEAILSQP